MDKTYEVSDGKIYEVDRKEINADEVIKGLQSQNAEWEQAITSFQARIDENNTKIAALTVKADEVKSVPVENPVEEVVTP